MKKAILTIILLATLAAMILGPVVWANETSCVTCDDGCSWGPANPHNVCTEFASGDGCIASGVCDLE